MRILVNAALLVVFLFFIFLLVRLVLDWVMVFARDWRPRGFALVVAETTYTITDPPLRLLRRAIPPLAIGPVRLDLAFMVLFLLCMLLLTLLPRLV